MISRALTFQITKAHSEVQKSRAVQQLSIGSLPQKEECIASLPASCLQSKIQLQTSFSWKLSCFEIKTNDTVLTNTRQKTNPGNALALRSQIFVTEILDYYPVRGFTTVEINVLRGKPLLQHTGMVFLVCE